MSGSQDPIEHLVANDYYEDPRIKRLVHLFQSVGLVQFDMQKLVPEERSYRGYSKAQAYCNPLDEGCLTWYCYQAATYVAREETKVEGRWRDMYFGFATQHVNGQQETHTFLHAWVADGNRCFIDPCFQAACDDQKEIYDRMKARGGWINMSRPRVIMGDLLAYRGVEIPLNVAVDILAEVPDKSYGNFWGYLIKNILVSDDKTNWFIDVVKNGGNGWAYEGKALVANA